ncbi:MAG: hypothetical protein JO093_23935 [Acidobacteria bacterium]|nr:hypothetical protein [Acidobacteriota bacterium]MBV9070318.1 hypothetical protein [Acidobacteriota bacterium]MBV9188680.1 hypothetical protein [Acidobacteriota bacterium]
MRRIYFVLVLAVAPFAVAAGWKKAYFGATKPGTWARYVDHSSDPANPDMTVTLTRLGDDEGRPQIEMKMDSGGKYPLALTRYTMKSGFDADRDLLDYGQSIVAGAGGDADTQTAFDANTVKLIAENMPAYGLAVTFKGSEVVDGKKADRYSYSIKRPGPSIESGDYWLSDAVPFGVVRNTFTITEGEKTTKFERKLVASGAGAVPVSTAAAPAKEAVFTLKEAYDEGLIRIDAEVDETVKNGEKVHLHITAKEEAPSPMTVTIPKGKTSLHVDIPLDDFIIDSPSAKPLTLNTEKGVDVDVKQAGEQRALKGKFQITTYEGQPLWTGSATVGPVK